MPRKRRHLSGDSADAEDVSSTVTKPRRTRPHALTRQERKKAAKPAQLIAYDFETTRIAVGTPRPLYLTAYGLAPEFQYQGAIRSIKHLREILTTRFLTDELRGAKFVAWNANAFDAYFIAAALLDTDEFILRPYLTKGNSLRGLKVMRKGEENAGASIKGWEFLDGMAMLGLAGTPLKKLLDTFAPDKRKLSEAIDFEREEFNPKNRAHCDYAMRDSEGLYYAMTRAQAILLDNFNQPLTVTMGNACIKIFKAHIPKGAAVHNLPAPLLDVVRSHVMRGGYCYCNARYQGPVWKYDLNQAYAAAMRSAPLPCGRAMHTTNGLHRYAKVYIARITATHQNNKIPFYYRTGLDRIESAFTLNRIDDTWITSIEVEQLKREGWKLTIHESWTWESAFNMRDYVDKLERIRADCEGGPSGPIGTVIKAVGNHSYGKTVEQLENTEFLIAASCPDGFAPYYADEFEPLPFVWWRFTDPREKDYHQPHIGAFIAAHVRMVVRRAALLNPDTWLYADTDCVVFSSDVTDQLDIDPKRYGAWKIEENGTPHLIIAKKIYFNEDTGKGHAKGLNVKRLTESDFRDWYAGNVPVQDQVQRNNFVAVMQGAEMYRLQRRRGTAVEATQR
ncbi:MAG: hypothetical protein EBU84_09760 [Actinobacteria bacterium]|nr:hypothetical protein [Actinomycetota bacterium]